MPILGVLASSAAGASGPSFTSVTPPSPATYFEAVYFLNSQFILVGGDGTNSTIATGTNGSTWTNQTLTNGGGSWVNAFAFGTSIYVMSDSNNQLKSSTNLTTWTDRTKTITGSIQALIWDGTNAKFIGVGSRGAGTYRSMYSTNGTSWTASLTGATQLNAIAVNAGTAVAVGNSGDMQTSTDGGVTWTAKTSSFGSTTIRSVAYFNGIWFAGGDSGTLATSTDAISWTQRTSTFGTDTVRAFGYYNGKYYMVGDNGKIAKSTDGTTWTATSSYGTNAQDSLAQNTTGLFVVAGSTPTLGYWQAS
jgi:hypothetical protein